MFPVDRQINKIIAVAKYKFQWKRKNIFNYCVESVPGCDGRISERGRRNYATSELFQKLTKAEKSHIIQRLEQIEKRNAKSSIQNKEVGSQEDYSFE